MLKSKITGLLWVLALAVLVALVWCHIRDRTSAENWGVPLDYGGDAPQIMGWIKAASEGDYIPFWGETIHRLGAPYAANWNDYPMYEKILTFGMGIFARMFGIFQAANFIVLFGHVTTAISFYLCCRFLKHSRVWSFVGAVLFSFTYYHFFRNLGHVLLAYSYTIPWALLSCWLIVASKRMKLGNRLAWVCLVTAAVMGLSNPYNLNLYLQLLCFAILVQFLRKRRRENLRIGLLSVAVAGIGFIAINLGTLLYNWAHGKNPSALDRHYFESELYALKPMEFLLPPITHHIHAFADLGAYYISGVFVRGEMTSPYLGIIGIAGLLWIFWETFLLMVRYTRRTKPFPPHAIQTTWIIFYSAIGGINCLLALCGMQFFRATDRYSIFISAIILLFLSRRMTVWSRRRSTGLTFSVAAVALVFGIFDETPRTLDPSETIQSGKLVASDVAFGDKMETQLPHGSMVFQMPVMTFPEAVPLHDISGYEMLRPYLVTRTMRFSFGSVRGRNREAWQWEVEKMPAAELISTLERYGFGAIYINRKGYEDRGESLLKEFAAQGRPAIFEDDAREQVLVRLHPSASPELPHTDDRAQILYRHGWSIKEHNPLENRAWTDGDATLTFFSESNQPTSFSFHCVIGTIAARHVTIMMNGQQLWTSEVPANQGVPVDITVMGRHGNNTIQLLTDTPPSHPKESPLPLAFTVINLQITRLQ